MLLLVLTLVGPAWGQVQTAKADGDGQPNVAAEERVDTGPFVVVPDVRQVMRRRIVKHFDFDERKLGNVERIPMYWQRYREDGFPHYLQGGFDEEVGHEAPPSFHLELRGGSLAYVYKAQNIPIHPQSDYLISAWIRPKALRHASAWICAFYYDRTGQKLPESEHFANPVGGPDADDQWREVTLRLPGGFDAARHIGVAVWLVQPPRPRKTTQKQLTIYRQDIRAGAWFDDIRVVRLPRGALTTGQPGNVFTDEQPAQLQVEISDPDGRDLDAVLSVHDAEGQQLLEREVRVSDQADAKAKVIELGRLEPGAYVGRLTIRSGEIDLSAYQTSFVQLGPRLNGPGWRNEGFGVVLGSSDYQCPEGASRLIDLLHLGHVKLPVAGPAVHRKPEMNQDPDANQLFEHLWQERVQAVAVLGGGRSLNRPSPVARASESWRTFLLALADHPEVWRPYLAPPLVSHASFAHCWQAGADGDDSLAWNARLTAGLTIFRQELDRLLPSSEMVVPWPILHEAPKEPIQSQYVSLHVPNLVRPEEIAPHIREFKKTRSQGLWAVVEPLGSSGYLRDAGLADLAKRLVLAHSSGVEAVFMPRPWFVTRHGNKAQTEPHETLIVFRTIAELLSQSTPSGDLYLDDGLRAVMFQRQSECIMAIWDEEAPEAGRHHVMYLGAEPQQVDLWGRVMPLDKAVGGHRMTIHRLPSFIRGTQAWHLKMRGTFALEPPQVESSFRLHERDVRFTNPRDVPISGVVRLEPPEGWDIRPKRIPFSLAPKEEVRTNVRIRFPSSEVAGKKRLTGHFTIDSDDTYRLIAQAPFTLGLDDFEVSTFAQIESGNVIVQQTITNRTGKQVDIEGYVLAPGRARMSRMYRRIGSGQTIHKKYYLENGEALRGQNIRVGVREIHGPRILNQTVRVQ